MSPMSSDMGGGEGQEPMNGLYGEAAGRSRLPLLSRPAETLQPIVQNQPLFIAMLSAALSPLLAWGKMLSG